MDDFATLYDTGWSEWLQFPNPEKKEYLYAPFGGWCISTEKQEKQRVCAVWHWW